MPVPPDAPIATRRDKIRLDEKFASFSEHWSPKIVAAVNDHEVRLVKFQGALDWHDHEFSDELFVVVKGTMVVHFRGDAVVVSEGEMILIPRQTEHRPYAEKEVWVALFERAGTANRPCAGGKRVAAKAEWI
jgi:mannose-6-phosphate isomerase-like protein (cupin superfamily)